MKCSHCQHDEVRRNGLCNACSLYLRRKGYLPSPKTLYERQMGRKRNMAYLVMLGPELTAELARLYATERRHSA